MPSIGKITEGLKSLASFFYNILLVSVLLLGSSNSVFAASPGDIITIAGGGVGDNTPANKASVNVPYGVGVDNAGNLYIADRGNGRIRKVTAATGIITTVAGGGTGGLGDNGPATEASLVNPTGVAVDNVGNIYIADSYNFRIRKVTAATGIISTVAGNGTAGFSGDGADATAANLTYPYGVSVDSSGNLYIADQWNQRIRKVTAATGIITTVAGNGLFGFAGDNGPATDARLNNPTGVSVDSAGNLYIADYDNGCIRKVTAATGIITTLTGIGTGGGLAGVPASAYGLYSPAGVTVNSAGNIYIADRNSQLVLKITAATGIITIVAGNVNALNTPGFSGDGGLATLANLSHPTGVAVDSVGNIYIADDDNSRIRKVTASTGIINSYAGNGTTGFCGEGTAASLARLSGPMSVALDNAGNVVIADSVNERIRKITADTGIISTIAGNGTLGYSGDGSAATASSFRNLTGVSTDSAGNLYIADSSNQRIRKVTVATGIISTVAGNGVAGYSGDGSDAKIAALNNPNDVAVDSAGNLYIADLNNHRVRKVTVATGIITTVAGNGVAGYSGDGTAATSSNLNSPHSIIVDSSGNLYLADSGNGRIRKVSAVTGFITTVAGNGTGGFSGDGAAAVSASLIPHDMALDNAGNLFIADTYNNRIRMVSASSGIITTVAGDGSGRFYGDNGPAISASLRSPEGISVDGVGNLYIADNNNQRIRKVIKPTYTVAAITYSPAGPYNTGDLVTITATFNDLVANTPVPHIALSGGNNIVATPMTKVDYTHYTYTHSVTSGSGTVSVSIPSGVDINGVALATTPGSGATFITNFSPVNGACGSANGGSFSLAPSANLCASGTPSIIPSGTGPWTWFCTGTTGLGTNASCRAELNTSTTVVTGSNVAATPTPAVSLNFSSVTTSGSVQVLSTAGPGANVTIADGTLFNTIPGTSYDITTTAGINGMTTVCVSYDLPNVPANTESLLRLLHYNGTAWTDISLLPVDTANHRVCGQTATLSPFVIGYSTSSGSGGGAAPVPALNPVMVIGAGLALCGLLRRRKR